jgi:hypothetical protein
LDIVYAGYNRLQADINCMNDILSLTSNLNVNKWHANIPNKKLNKDWKYFFNMASTEFPLKTNYELTRILNMFNGSNEIEIFDYPYESFIENQWVVQYDEYDAPKIVNSGKEKTKPPHGYTIVKGSAYNAFSRKFVEYVLSNRYTKDLLAWIVDTYSPDEL